MSERDDLIEQALHVPVVPACPCVGPRAYDCPHQPPKSRAWLEPWPGERVVLIAPSVQIGHSWATRNRQVTVVAIVTPRSPNAARGQLADMIHVLPAMREHAGLDRLLDDARPALDTNPRARR